MLHSITATLATTFVFAATGFLSGCASQTSSSSPPVAPSAATPTQSVEAEIYEPYPVPDAGTWADFVDRSLQDEGITVFGQVEELLRWKGGGYGAVIRASNAETDRPFGRGQRVILGDLTRPQYLKFFKGDLVEVEGTADEDWYLINRPNICSQNRCWLPYVSVSTMTELPPPASEVLPADKVQVNYILSIKGDCSGWGYSDIKRGAEVEVFDGSESLLGFGRLRGKGCSYLSRFRINRSPDGLYRVTAGSDNRGFLNFREKDLVSGDTGDSLTVVANLG